MVAYEKEKDVLIEEIGMVGNTKEVGDNFILVGYYRYNEADPKIGINRVWIKKDGSTSPGKLGRVTADEAKELSNILLRWIGRKEKEKTKSKIKKIRKTAHP